MKTAHNYDLGIDIFQEKTPICFNLSTYDEELFANKVKTMMKDVGVTNPQIIINTIETDLQHKKEAGSSQTPFDWLNSN